MTVQPEGEFTYEVKKRIIVISSKSSGWSKELTYISWNGKEPVYDIREWSPNGQKMSKGITMTQEEMESLLRSLNSVDWRQERHEDEG